MSDRKCSLFNSKKAWLLSLVVSALFSPYGVADRSVFKDNYECSIDKIAGLKSLRDRHTPAVFNANFSLKLVHVSNLSDSEINGGFSHLVKWDEPNKQDALERKVVKTTKRRFNDTVQEKRSYFLYNSMYSNQGASLYNRLTCTSVSDKKQSIKPRSILCSGAGESFEYYTSTNRFIYLNPGNWASNTRNDLVENSFVAVGSCR